MVDSVLSIGARGVSNSLANARQAAEDIVKATTPDTSDNSSLAKPSATQPEARDVTADLTKGVVDLKTSELQVEASAAVVRTADEILGTIINTKA